MKKFSKVLAVGLMFIVIFGYGAKKKKINNKYIFGTGGGLVVFDADTKTVQRKKIEVDQMLYFPKFKKIIVKGYAYKLTSVNVNDLTDSYSVDLKQFNRYSKPVNFIASWIAKNKNMPGRVFFAYAEWDMGPTREGYYETFVGEAEKKHRQPYIWNIANNTFTKTIQWTKNDVILDDPQASEEFHLIEFVDSNLSKAKARYEEDKLATETHVKRYMKANKRDWKYGLKFKELLKKGKIDVGSYSSNRDLFIASTGGRYMVVANKNNGKTYMVHMKTRETHLLLEKSNPFSIGSFIIEKNEDDLDLDKE